MNSPISRHLVAILDREITLGKTFAEAIAESLVGAAVKGDPNAAAVIIRAVEVFDPCLESLDDDTDEESE